MDRRQFCDWIRTSLATSAATAEYPGQYAVYQTNGKSAGNCTQLHMLYCDQGGLVLRLYSFQPYGWTRVHYQTSAHEEVAVPHLDAQGRQPALALVGEQHIGQLGGRVVLPAPVRRRQKVLRIQRRLFHFSSLLHRVQCWRTHLWS